MPDDFDMPTWFNNPYISSKDDDYVVDYDYEDSFNDEPGIYCSDDM